MRCIIPFFPSVFDNKFCFFTFFFSLSLLCTLGNHIIINTSRNHVWKQRSSQHFSYANVCVHTVYCCFIALWCFKSTQPSSILNRALTNMKLKLKGAQTGHSLLKRKSEALTKRFRGITVKIDEVKSSGGFMFLGKTSIAVVINIFIFCIDTIAQAQDGPSYATCFFLTRWSSIYYWWYQVSANL